MTDHNIQPSRRFGTWAARLLTGLALSITVLGAGATAASAQSDTDDPALLEAGQVAYETYCADCHGIDGTGSVAGRPLTDIALQEPDRTVHIESVTNGKGGMPAMSSVATDEEIDAAVTYVRLTFVTAQAEGDEELPATGSSTSSLLWIGLVLVAVGGAAMYLSRPDPTGAELS